MIGRVVALDDSDRGRIMDFAKEFNLKIPSQIGDKDKILVVDEQQDMRMILVHQLRKLNFPNIVQCKDGMEALDLLRRETFAVVICAMDLPQMNGLSLLSEMREDPNIQRPPFCILMANVSKEKIMLAIESGVDEVLVKPFTLDDIVPKLRKSFITFHNPRNPEKVYELAKEKLRQGSIAEAQHIYTLLSQSAPESARPLVGLARVAAQNKQNAAALELLQQAEGKNSNYVHLYTVRGDIFLEQQDIEAAIFSYKKAIALSPLNPIRYKVAGEVLFKAHKFAEAADILKEAVAKEISFPALYHLLSQSYYSLKDYANSAKYIRKAIVREPDNITYLNQLALSLKESGELEEAKKYYNQVLKIDPENIQGLFNKAILLAQSGKTEEAIKILDRVVKKNPDFTKGVHKLEELRSSLSKAS